jgi:hypothetical protein
MAIIVSDKGALVTSQAGMRLIAQQTLLNRGDFERLRSFIAESYTAAALETQPADDRLADLQTMFEAAGKLKVIQVIGTGKHQVIVLMQGQKAEAPYLVEMIVEEDYPHKITVFGYQPLAAS